MDTRYNIFIYDDNPAAVYELKACAADCFKETGDEAEFCCFDDYKQAEAVLSGEKCLCDVFFLDIELDKGKNGIELADKLIQKFPQLKIVFITGYADKYSQAIFMQSQRLRPYGYIAKPFDKAVVKRILTLVLNDDQSGKESTVELNKGRHKLSIRCSDIIYIESYKRKLIFHLRSSAPEEIYGKISEISGELPGGFLQCHRSYIVNTDYVHSVDPVKNIVELNNGEAIFLGNTKKDLFMQEFFRYKGGLSK